MTNLTRYIKEYLIKEGGHAVECSPMTQPQARAVYKEVQEKLLPLFGIDGEDGGDHCALGSFGKKVDTQTSGDIDVAVSVDKIASSAGITMDDVEEYICNILDKNNINYVYGRGIHVISVQWPVPDTDQFGQVDIMPTTSLDFSKWMYYAPDFRVAESKYKGLYRNQLIMAILKHIKRDVVKTTAEGEVEEYERYALRLYKGLAITRRSLMGKRGKLVKTETALKEFEKDVTNVPDEITSITFGDKVSANMVLTFESAYSFFMSDRFPYKKHRVDIIKSFIKELRSGKFPIPSELERDWSSLIENNMI